MLKETSHYKPYGLWMLSCHYHLTYLFIIISLFIFSFNRSFVNRIVVILTKSTGVCTTEYRKILHVPYLLSNVYNMVP
jgi:hypothetical protein